MGLSCPPAPKDKKQYITDIGKILVEENGKKKYYKPEEVKKAHKQSTWYHGLDFSCWAMCVFVDHGTYDAYHAMTGEVCDYVAMKTEMLNGLSNNSSSFFFDTNSTDLDVSWLDWGDVLSGLFEGLGDIIGDILGGVFDGL